MTFLFDFLPLRAVSLLLFAKILCVTIFVWNLLRKMSAMACERSDLPLVRALIFARGENGASLQEIKNDHEKATGWSFQDDDESLTRWISEIDYIETGVRDSQVVFFSKVPKPKPEPIQEKENPRPTVFRKPRQPHKEIHSTPKTWANALIFRRNQLTKSAFRHHERFIDQSFEANQTAIGVLNAQLDKNNNEKPKQRFKSTLFEPSGKNQLNESYLNVTNKVCRLHGEMPEEIDFYRPEFHKCILVGDNFFLNMAMQDLGFRVVKHKKVWQSGFCVSGQTIADVTRTIADVGRDKFALLNIGSIDIVNGQELIEMMNDMIKLWKVCMANDIKLIMTTLPQLSNCRLTNRILVTDGFNKFLMLNPYDFPVIKLHEALLTKNGLIDLNCYQNYPRYVSGLKVPIVFWNSVGRQRIIKTLKLELNTSMAAFSSM